MTKSVARQWLLKQANGKLSLKLGSENVAPIPDLGVKEDFEGFYVWSSDRDALKTLERWFAKRGLETNWIW